jgi:hypothetical protein
VFVGWMVLLVAQVSLAAAGRIRLHRTVGRWGIAYGYGVLAMGLVAGLAAPVMHFNAGEWSHDRAAAFLLTTIGDMVLFGSLFTAAVVYRNRPEIHKRLMLAATVALLFAAVGRLDYLVSSNAVLVAVWLSPLVIGAAYDLVTRRRVHPAYIISTAWLVVGATRLLFADSEAWLRIGRPLLDAIR